MTKGLSSNPGRFKRKQQIMSRGAVYRAVEKWEQLQDARTHQECAQSGPKPRQARDLGAAPGWFGALPRNYRHIGPTVLSRTRGKWSVDRAAPPSAPQSPDPPPQSRHCISSFNSKAAVFTTPARPQRLIPSITQHVN